MWPSLLYLLVILGFANAIFFPSMGGGGGCGCGCGGGGGSSCGGGCGGDQSCMPKFNIGCQKYVFSVPTFNLKLPMPEPCPSCCGGKRKKRDVEGDDKCTDETLRKIVTDGIRTSPKESRDNILASLKKKHPDTRFLVTCLEGEVDFATSAEQFCIGATPNQQCIVSRAIDE
ncbi:hypothetical protein WR25_19683 [Diploscapter pachys]|uniref:Ground-like domain-containing protein n=1 Tax=Diploscapter pachys TaxID=2018661 RepID=A0A2A2JVC5_9BILA|nr:hypothetical protein WR25_19683 [Diploscapter pachys]